MTTLPLTVINATPHDLTVVVPGGKIFIPQSETLARVALQEVDLGLVPTSVGAVPMITTKKGDVVGLPPYKEGVAYIVSTLVATRLRELGDQRPDLLTPGRQIREGGVIVGCEALVVA